MDRQQKEAALMEAMSDKTLSFGCDVLIKTESTLKIKWKYYWGKTKVVWWSEWCRVSWPLLREQKILDLKKKTKYKIIWHPVYI